MILRTLTYLGDDSQQASICNKDVLKTRFQDIQNVDLQDVHKT